MLTISDDRVWGVGSTRTYRAILARQCPRNPLSHAGCQAALKETSGNGGGEEQGTATGDGGNADAPPNHGRAGEEKMDESHEDRDKDENTGLKKSGDEDPMERQLGRSILQRPPRVRAWKKCLLVFSSAPNPMPMQLWSTQACPQLTNWLSSVKCTGRIPLSSCGSAISIQMA